MIFDLINVFTNYSNLQKSIWLTIKERVQGTSKIEICKDITIHLLQDYKVYGKYVKTKKGLKVYAQSIKTQCHKIEIK